MFTNAIVTPLTAGGIQDRAAEPGRFAGTGKLTLAHHVLLQLDDDLDQPPPGVLEGGAGVREVVAQFSLVLAFVGRRRRQVGRRRRRRRFAQRRDLAFRLATSACRRAISFSSAARSSGTAWQAQPIARGPQNEICPV